MEVQDALKEHDYCSELGTYLYDQPWPALDNCDMILNNLHRVASPMDVGAMSDSVSMTQWTPNNCLTA